MKTASLRSLTGCQPRGDISRPLVVKHLQTADIMDGAAVALVSHHAHAGPVVAVVVFEGMYRLAIEQVANDLVVALAAPI